MEYHKKLSRFKAASFQCEEFKNSVEKSNVRQVSLPSNASNTPTKKKKPLLRLNSDPKILPSAQSGGSTEKPPDMPAIPASPINNPPAIPLLRLPTQDSVESGDEFNVADSRFLRIPVEKLNGNAGGGGNSSGSGGQNPAKRTRSDQTKLLVKQKSLGRTLSTSVLRIKKKRSFWSNEKAKQ